MLAQAQTRSIGPCEYEVLPLPAGVSLRVMTRVLKMAAPAFAEVSSLRQAAFALGALFSAGLSEIDEDVLLYVTTEFSKVTQIVSDGGSRKVLLSTCFDEHFRGRIPDLFGWLKFAAEVTYGPLDAAMKTALSASGQSVKLTPDAPASPSAG